jgi:hypothetical protein
LRKCIEGLIAERPRRWRIRSGLSAARRSRPEGRPISQLRSPAAPCSVNFFVDKLYLGVSVWAVEARLLSVADRWIFADDASIASADCR